MKTSLVQSPASSSPAIGLGAGRRIRNAAFTLVELLTVIAIIVLLVGLTIGILGFATKKGALSKAEGQMQLIITGLMRYEKEWGEFPEPVDNTGDGKSSAKALYQALTGDGDNFIVVAGAEGGTPSNGKIDDPTKMMVEGLDPEANKHGLISTDFALVDPFGQYWHYRKYDPKGVGDETHNRTFDLWSVADDKRGDNEAKWIKNW